MGHILVDKGRPMTGFIVSTAAVFLTAWIVYAATYRAAHLDGYQKGWAESTRRQVYGVPAGTPDCNGPVVRPPPGGTFTGYQPRPLMTPECVVGWTGPAFEMSPRCTATRGCWMDDGHMGHCD